MKATTSINKSGVSDSYKKIEDQENTESPDKEFEDTQNKFHRKKTMKEKMNDLLRKSFKKEQYESIYEVRDDTDKETEHKLTNDSASMGFAVHLNAEFNGLNQQFSPSQ